MHEDVIIPDPRVAPPPERNVKWKDFGSLEDLPVGDIKPESLYIHNGTGDRMAVTAGTTESYPIMHAMFCMDCFSMSKKKEPAIFLGFGFSLCEDHATKFIANQKEVNHESWLKANGGKEPQSSV